METLRYQVRHSPAFSAVRITLAPGQRLRAASGSLYMRDGAISIDAKMEGGFFGAVKRAVGGQSFFTSTFIGDPGRETWLDLTQVLPGEITVVDINPPSGLVLTQGSWLASTADVQLDTKWGGLRSLLGGDRLFAVHLTGAGQAIIGSYGAFDNFELQPGQEVLVDMGHLVGYTDTVQVNLQTQGGGLANSFKSGEMITVRLVGPGRVWTQSRSERELGDWVRRQVPTTNTQ